MDDNLSKMAEIGTNNNNISPSQAKKTVEEKIYKPKLLRHTHSLRAYNDVPIDENYDTVIITSVLRSPNSPDSFRNAGGSILSRDSLGSSNSYDYATIGNISNSGSDLNSNHNEMGSTAKLISSKVKQSWTSWAPYLTTVVCAACMAANYGNLYRLPQTTLIRGGLPFLIVYIFATIFIGLPLLFLELGIGQISQEGVLKSWRAVPFFKGLGYVKLLASLLLSIYYPIFMALSLYYIIWALKGSLPFKECSKVKQTENGYVTYGKSAQECLRLTFLKSPFEDPYWYGIFVILLFIVWTIITVSSIKKTRSYIRALVFMVLPTLGCFLFLFIKSIILQNEFDGLSRFFDDTDWSLLKSANIWYYACIQVFFSTNIGIGSFTTTAGIIYKISPFWTAFGYIIINAVFGFTSVIISQSLSTASNTTSTSRDIAELSLVSLIYDVGSSQQKSDLKTWTVVFFFLILLSGFISMATLTYTLLKAITLQNKGKMKWWHASVILSFVCFILGCSALLKQDFDIVHLLDHYVIGNIILIVSVMEVLVMIAFYGIEKLRSDFEFMLGHVLSRIWLLLWWIIPLLLTVVFAWAMITLKLEGIFKDDPAWLYGIGWGIVLSATIFIFIFGMYIVSKQDGYTIMDKFKTSLKPSTKWGPTDPMSRHNWLQWNTKAQQGERDFTLKRKGTKDYTRSIKKNQKLASSDISTLSIQGVYKTKSSKESNGNSTNGTNIYNEIPNSSSPSSDGYYQSTMSTVRVKSLPNTPNSMVYDKTSRVISLPNKFDVDESNGIKKNNPLAYPERNKKFQENGTLRKGPYIICDEQTEHVCHRKSNEIGEVTEL